MGFTIDIKTKLKEVDFLDVIFNLRKGIYQLYKKKTKTKPNDKPLYI